MAQLDGLWHNVDLSFSIIEIWLTSVEISHFLSGWLLNDNGNGLFNVYWINCVQQQQLFFDYWFDPNGSFEFLFKKYILLLSSWWRNNRNCPKTNWDTNFYICTSTSSRKSEQRGVARCAPVLGTTSTVYSTVCTYLLSTRQCLFFLLVQYSTRYKYYTQYCFSYRYCSESLLIQLPMQLQQSLLIQPPVQMRD